MPTEFISGKYEYAVDKFPLNILNRTKAKETYSTLKNKGIKQAEIIKSRAAVGGKELSFVHNACNIANNRKNIIKKLSIFIARFIFTSLNTF